MEKTKNNYWNKVTIVSFILSILIIIRHNSSFSNYFPGFPDIKADSPAVNLVYFLFHRAFSSLAVPMFFVISGFNFYRNFDMSKTLEKYKSRFRSLVIPYWVWNTIYLAFCLVTSYSFLSRFFIGREKTPFSLGNILYGIFYHELCNGHFWYVFDLILFTLLCPLIYKLLENRYVGVGFIAVLMVLYFVLPEYKGVVFILHNVDSPIFYVIGAYFGIHYKDLFTRDYSKSWYMTGILGLIIYGVYHGFTYYMKVGNRSIELIMTILACASLWLAADTIKNIKVRPFMKTSFFIYAFHGLVSPIVCKLVYLILPKSSWMAIPSFFIALIITLAVTAYTGLFISKYIPKFNSVLTGSR